MSKKQSNPTTLSFDDFLVVEKYETPQKMVLKFNGKETEHHLMVIGRDSKLVRRARNKAMVNAAKKVKEDQWNDDCAELLTVDILISAIQSWSFVEPCTDENKRKLLESNPSICQQLDEFVGDDSVFLGK